MGKVFARITIKNATDVGAAMRGLIREDEVRSVKVKALVDTGADTLVFNERIREKLGLKTTKRIKATLADGSTHIYNKTEPVSINWKDRESVCIPTFVPTATKVLLGAIALEDLDLVVDPKRQVLRGRHGKNVMLEIF